MMFHSSYRVVFSSKQVFDVYISEMISDLETKGFQLEVDGVQYQIIVVLFN